MNLSDFVKTKANNAVRVLSFNVLAPVWVWTDGELRRSVKKQAFLRKQYRITRHIKLLKKIKPDIIFLQETTPSMLAKIRAVLPEYYVPPCFSKMCWTRGNTHAVNGNAILWKRGTFLSAKCSTVFLDRVSYAAVITGILANGKTIKLVNVHLEWNNPEKAAKQFREIFKQSVITTQDKHVVIAGDFNMGDFNVTRYPIIPDLLRHGLYDILNGIQTHPFTLQEYKSISHILVRNINVVKKGVGTAKSINHCVKKFGSDHFPIFADLRTN